MKRTFFNFTFLCLMCFAWQTSDTQATTIDTTDSSSGYTGILGENNLQTLGQTFTAPDEDTLLLDWTYFLRSTPNSEGPSNFVFYLMAWDSTQGHAIGEVLFQSETQTATTSFEQYTFDVGVTLQSGMQYVAFLSVAGLFDGLSDKAQLQSSLSDVYSGGTVVLSLFSGIENWATDSWNVAVNNELTFIANFTSPSTSIPTPGALGLLLLGLVGLVCKRKPASGL